MISAVEADKSKCCEPQTRRLQRGVEWNGSEAACPARPARPPRSSPQHAMPDARGRPDATGHLTPGLAGLVWLWPGWPLAAGLGWPKGKTGAAHASMRRGRRAWPFRLTYSTPGAEILTAKFVVPGIVFWNSLSAALNVDECTGCNSAYTTVDWVAYRSAWPRGTRGEERGPA